MRNSAIAQPAVPRLLPGSADPAAHGGAASGSALAHPEHQEAIVASHERCVALGVARIDAPDLGPIARAEFTIALARNRRLHGHAAPVMAMLHEQIARTESMVVLTDSAGTVIHAIGDDDFLERASKVALRPGANWSERSKGTNAVGTALVDERPTLVHGGEHFLHANHFLTCSAAPIQDPRGNMLGVLDVSGDQRSYHPHTLALVRMSARMIENRWLSEDFTHALRLHFHSRPEFIGTLMEGQLAVAEDGHIVGANRGALEQLRMSGAVVRKHTLETLFGVTLPALVDQARAHGAAHPLEPALGPPSAPMAAPLLLRTADGRVFNGFAGGLLVHAAPACGPARSRAAAGQAAAPGTEAADPGADGPASAPSPGRAAGSTGAAANPVVVPLPAASRSAPSAPTGGPAPLGGAASHPSHSHAPHSHAPHSHATHNPARPQAPSRGSSPTQALSQLDTGDAAFSALLEKLARVLDRGIPILLLGETGTGKETLARALHADSARAGSPFVAVHCASVPPGLLEAELFGEAAARAGKRGAPAGEAGAAAQIGKIQQAHGGTLFVDDVGELPLPVQAQLLRVLQEGLVTPLGGTRSVAVDVMVISAHRGPLRECVERQTFREDLYYRLNGLAVRLPPLRERSDFEAIVRRVLAAVGGPRAPELTREVKALFAAYAWPGNVRQLQQVLRSACAMAGSAPAIERRHLPDDLLDELTSAPAAARGQAAAAEPAAGAPTQGAAPSPATVAATAEPGRLEEMERALIQRTLDAVGGNISEASKRLGISRNTIYRKLRWNR